MLREVHIVALAARTAVGLQAESTAAAIRARISRVGDHPRFVTEDGERLRCGRVVSIDPELTGSDRLATLLSQTWSEFSRKLGPALSTDTRMFLALPEARPGFSKDDAQQVARTLTKIAAPLHFKLARDEHGHASGLRCLEQAVDLVRSGRTEVCVVGGVDSYLHAETIDWLESQKRLARDDVRRGVIPGEGCVLLAIASDAWRKQHRLESWAIVRSVACAIEARDAEDGAGLLGEALTKVFLSVGAGLTGSTLIDDVYCDISDERERSTDYGFALLRTATLFRDGHQYKTAVSEIGDIGAASAPLSCLLAARAWSRKYASGPSALVFAASWGGLRAAALLQQART